MSFINDVVKPGNMTVDKVANEILLYFHKLTPVPNVIFHVAGYKPLDKGVEQQVWNVNVGRNSCIKQNPSNDQGVCWDGEQDILGRLHSLAPTDWAFSISALSSNLM